MAITRKIRIQFCSDIRLLAIRDWISPRRLRIKLKRPSHLLPKQVVRRDELALREAP